MRRRYPWDEWQSGDVFTLPADEAKALAGVLRTRAARVGRPVRTKQLNVRTQEGLERRLAFQFRPDGGDFAPLFGQPEDPPDAEASCPSCGRVLEPA